MPRFELNRIASTIEMAINPAKESSVFNGIFSATGSEHNIRARIPVLIGG